MCCEAINAESSKTQSAMEELEWLKGLKVKGIDKNLRNEILRLFLNTGDLIFKQNDHAFRSLNKVDEKKGTFEMNIEELNATLSKNQSAMAKLEWCKLLWKGKSIDCYDYFKYQNDQKNFRIEMLRLPPETFLDSMVDMVEKHELPIGIQFQNNWINAGTACRRLVEPVDIADYYGKQKGNDSCLVT